MKSPVRILSIDGGGVGGIIPARLIERVVAERPDFLQKVDLFAGTSTGGLIALALAGGMSPTDLCAAYLTQGPQIFSWWKRRPITEWPLRAKYDPSGLLGAVQALVGDKTLADLPGNVIVPVTALQRSDGGHTPAGMFVSTAWRLSQRKDVVEKHLSSRWPCIELAMATCAAPTYFPAHTVNIAGTPGLGVLCWDGGIVANNPALAAVSELYSLASGEVPDVRVLSLGTGYKDTIIDAGDWGLLECARPVIADMLVASVSSTAFMLSQLLGHEAVRVTPPTADYKIDDTDVMTRLDQCAADYAANSLGAVPQPDGSTCDLRQWLTENW
jgi:patatin-like phospholipase/acyl hydrolase